MSEKETFETTELDDGQLDDVAGGQSRTPGDNLDCPNENCGDNCSC